LSSIEPNEVDQALIQTVSSAPFFCRHFHVPLQSGDDGILKRMNRRYTAVEYAGLIAAIKERIPEAAVGVDVMAGFPGEDDRAHRNTVELLRELPVSYLHVFPFSPRQGTPAAAFPGRVDPGVVGDRTAELRAIGREKRQAFYRSCLGGTYEVVSEGWASGDKTMIKGLSDNYLPILLPSDEIIVNELISVTAENLTEGGILGRRYDPSCR
jgi:threonylcarbamoyladenosine tRNA methylthiotransferase MtaB